MLLRLALLIALALVTPAAEFTLGIDDRSEYPAKQIYAASGDTFEHPWFQRHESGA
jgi:hypothetical protein